MAEDTLEAMAAILQQVHEFTETLTPEQIEDLLTGRAGLALVDVDPEQSQ